MQEGVKIGARLQEELKIVKNIHEKESWAGIPKMNPGGLDPHSAYKNYRMDRQMSPRGIIMTPQIFHDREAYRKAVIDEITADIKANKRQKIKEAVEEERIL